MRRTGRRSGSHGSAFAPPPRRAGKTRAIAAEARRLTAPSATAHSTAPTAAPSKICGKVDETRRTQTARLENALCVRWLKSKAGPELNQAQQVSAGR